MTAVLSAFSPIRNFKHLFIRPPGNFAVLDGLRAFSMLLILVFHSFAIYATASPDVQMIDLVEESTWSAWIWNSDKGVDIFFVISGFLITGILCKELNRTGTIHFGRFYVRRFLRLSPAYWLVLIVYALLNLPNTANIWANVLYVNNFLPYEDQAMNWSWSLAIEEQFYLIYPVLLLFLVQKTRRPLFWMWVLLGVSVVIRFLIIVLDDELRTSPGSRIALEPEFHAYHFSVLYDNLYTRYGALLCGCIAAWYYFHHESVLRPFLNSTAGKVIELLSFALIILFMFLPVLSHRFDDQTTLIVLYQTFSRVLFSGAIAYLALVCLERSYLSRVLNLLFANRFWYPLAQLSYSMYLVHVFPIAILVQLGLDAMAHFPERYDYTHWQAMTLICAYSTVITVIMALIIYLLIERPLMNLRR